jgi:uncharacterized protein (DUF2342 family)
MGERFVRRVHEAGGMSAVNRIFDSPETLPTIDEVRAPDRWLARVG